MSRYIGSISATSLINSVVDDDGHGARTMFIIASATLLFAATTALLVTPRVPSPVSGAETGAE